MILLIYISGLLLSFSAIDNVNASSKNLLTNGSKKSWYLAVQTPEGNFPYCKPSGPQAKDNTYTFYADGRFIFDRGQIIEDSDCTVNCCIDVISIEGKWKFTDDGKKLELFAVNMKNEPAYAINHMFIDGDVAITADKFTLSQQSFKLEFLPK